MVTCTVVMEVIPKILRGTHIFIEHLWWLLLNFKELNMRLYRLPREETLKTVWKQKLKRKKLPVDKNIRVCNLRFE